MAKTTKGISGQFANSDDILTPPCGDQNFNLSSSLSSPNIVLSYSIPLSTLTPSVRRTEGLHRMILVPPPGILGQGHHSANGLTLGRLRENCSSKKLFRTSRSGCWCAARTVSSRLDSPETAENKMYLGLYSVAQLFNRPD